MIENKLREYKSNLSKLHLIECNMKEIENQIQLIEPSYISATAYSLTPKSITNKFSSIVENSAIESEQSKAEADRLKAELWQLAKDRVILQYKTEYVQALLEGLTEEELFVVERYYIDGISWGFIINRYQEKYKIYKSVRALKYKRNDAFRKMERNAGIKEKSLA